MRWCTGENLEHGDVEGRGLGSFFQLLVAAGALPGWAPPALRPTSHATAAAPYSAGSVRPPATASPQNDWFERSNWVCFRVGIQWIFEPRRIPSPLKYSPQWSQNMRKSPYSWSWFLEGWKHDGERWDDAWPCLEVALPRKTWIHGVSGSSRTHEPMSSPEPNMYHLRSSPGKGISQPDSTPNWRPS